MMDNLGIDRRMFLKSMAAVSFTTGMAANAVMAQDAAPAAAGDAAPFRMALIGCGGQGNVDMQNALRVPGIKIVAVCDIVEGRRGAAAQAAADASGEECRQYVEYKELLEKETELDAVLIATPLFTHAPITIAAFEAGRHVFCEKCMAYTIQECKDMIMAQMKAKKILQIGHHFRYHPLYWHAKRSFIEPGLLGEITSVYAQWNRNGSWRRGAIEGDYSQWGYTTPDMLANWRLYKELSGGLMTELASHQIDAVTWMLGETPSAVQGVGGIDHWDDGRTVFDNVHVTYEYPSGVKFDYQSGTTNAFSMFGNECHEIIKGTKGTLVLTHLNPNPYQSAGWFFLEEGAQKEIWFDLAHHEDVYGKNAILLDCTVTEGPPLAGQPISTLMNNKDEQGNKIENPRDYRLAKMTYQVEMEEFVVSCRENKVPSCDGLIGMKSAADAILANQAMTEKTRIEMTEDLFKLV